MTVNLAAVEVSSGAHLSCVVDTREAPDACEIVVSVAGRGPVSAAGYDFEEALQGLRVRLESQGLRLLCNRFRRDAFISSLSRQMSNGLSCYLVLPGRPVDPKRIVPCLDPTAPGDVVSASEADNFIAKWKESTAAPALVRWFNRLGRR
ncbi:hypothetical protein [Intrasporangium sp. YIM S08009]|uniref:hypothetical protein n=1 Tax=Intrasporangium zincisolvens TaxID=3080018 RepID=UPI002B05D2C1|nr:hypothetical protein [Intrasporangium sp. YIM S08009]